MIYVNQNRRAAVTFFNNHFGIEMALKSVINECLISTRLWQTLKTTDSLSFVSTVSKMRTYQNVVSLIRVVCSDKLCCIK